MPKALDDLHKAIKKNLRQQHPSWSNDKLERVSWAIANKQWKTMNQTLNNKQNKDWRRLEFFAPITEVVSNVGPSDNSKIKGIAINSTTTRNGVTYLESELENSASTLMGRPLLKDHNNSIDSVIGKVIESKFNPVNKNVEFTAVVMDEAVKKKLSQGLLGSVSIGAMVSDIEETDTAAIAHGIEFVELSIVAIPADPNAAFNITHALNESLNLKRQENYEITEAQITSMEKKRKQLGLTPSEFYAAPRDPPSSSSLPIFDAAHTRNAMARFSQTKFKSPEEKRRARNAILRAAKKFGIDSSNFRKSTESYSENNSIERREKIIDSEKMTETKETLEEIKQKLDVKEKILVELSDKLHAYEANERKVLESKYTELREKNKLSKKEDLSKISNESLTYLISELEELELKAEEDEEKPKEPKEEAKEEPKAEEPQGERTASESVKNLKGKIVNEDSNESINDFDGLVIDKSESGKGFTIYRI